MTSPAASLGRFPPFRVAGPALLALLVAHSGCTSALSTALLRDMPDMPWDGVEHAAEAEPSEKPDDAGAESSASDVAPEPVATPAETAAARAAAIEEAMKRLSGVATLDANAEAALVEILRGTPQEDWPVVIEEFTASLSASPPAAEPVVAAQPPAAEPTAAPSPPAAATPVEQPPSAPAAAEQATTPPAVVATPTATDHQPAVEPAPATPAPATPAPATPAPATPAPATSLAPAGEPVAVEPASPAEPTAPHLAIRNACFASRVRGWGAVDRFAESRFQAGQELIVYFELDDLSADESAAGHTTRIDTSLRLVDAHGAVVHTWSFEPITETCPSRRRDYFARYLVRLPDGLEPGACRVELAVTDTLARVTATGSLPCEVAGN